MGRARRRDGAARADRGLRRRHGARVAPFADRYGEEMNVTVLVDFANDSVGTALEVADALGDRALGGAAGHLRDARRPRAAEAARRVCAEGVDPELVRSARALDARGYGACKIVVSGGFTADRITRLRGRGRAGRRLRRGLVPAARLQRLHGRRRDGRRRAGRQGRARAPTERRGSAPSASAHQRDEAHALQAGGVAACRPPRAAARGTGRRAPRPARRAARPARAAPPAPAGSGRAPRPRR